MGTEKTGFEPEPVFPLAEQAENQVLRERLYAAQNAVVRLEGERDGKVREALLSLAAELEGCAQAATAREQSERGHGHERAAVARGVLAAAYTDAARMARARAERDETATVDASVADGEQAQSPDAPEGSPGRKHLDPCTRCNGSGSEPDTDPDEAAGLVLVAREDVRAALAVLRGGRSPGLSDALSRLDDATGSAPSGHPTSPDSDAERPAHTPGGPEAPEGFQGRDGLPRILAMLRSHAGEEEATVTDNPRHEYDKGLFVAGMRRAIDLIEHGDQPAEALPS
jgi:hypothetical protein